MNTTTCAGSNQLARDVKLGTGKWFGRRFGTCRVCGRPVNVRKSGPKLATPHKES